MGLASPRPWFTSILGFTLASIWSIATLHGDEAEWRDEAKWHGLLAARCLECHQGEDASAGLDLSSRAGLNRGSDSGAVYDPENAKNSLLWKVIESGAMPPKAKLDEAERTLLIEWLEQGADLPEKPIDRLARSSAYRAGWDWWALQPLQPSQPPEPIDSSDALASWSRTSIDRFVLDRLRANHLHPNATSTPRAWLRRVYFDLTGLPPTYEERLAFEEDPSEDAYEAVVDRLLGSPEYGERWARHWLDVARFGESDGFERNFPRRHSWPYRDWVIRAFNDDMPYDQFVRMQIAGDQIDPTANGLAAVGFLVCGLHNTVVGDSERMKRLAKQDELEDKIGTLTQSFLGLTAQCARCHDHKYDPISSESYYQLAGALQGILHGDREASHSTEKIYTVLSDPHPGPAHVLVRGDPFQLGASVQAGGIVGLHKSEKDFGLDESASDGQRRLELANWIVSAHPALLARVIVNRIWHYHFGAGIVETPNDFGFNGARPSHPELLDHLADDFLRTGMSIKRLHRKIVLSQTYRSSSEPNPHAMAIDRSNRWLWRYPIRRLDGESVRDAMLSISGLLRRQWGGEGFQDVDVQEINGTTYYIPKSIDAPDSYRRTIYRFSPRCERNPILDGLDCPDPSATAPRRASTTTPLQALSLLNNEFVLLSSDAVTLRLREQFEPKPVEDPTPIVQGLFRSILLREPDEQEAAMGSALVRVYGPQALARSLWNANEFLILE
jgi:mono/diheme cytochrome c family protein